MGRRLEGEVALVKGCGSGIGRGCALMFAREGALVVGCDVAVAGVEETMALARAEGLSLEAPHTCDLTVPSEVERVVSFAVERHGGLDILSV